MPSSLLPSNLFFAADINAEWAAVSQKGDVRGHHIP
jgi:hypothetical protein